MASDLNAPSDGELIAAVRGGDRHAYGMLFERHRTSALRLARQLAGASDADDLVSDAFVKILKVLTAGGGPDLAFRPYLLTAVRRLHVDRIRHNARVRPSDELESFDPGVPFMDPAVQEFENLAASKAFSSLPERWQLVLWHVEVEGQKPAEVAVLLGMSPNSVSALAYRAREGLRQAYLQMHMADTAAEECRWVTERLGARVRNGLSRRDTAKVDEHLDECARCSAVYLELSEVNSNLSGILAPLLLGAAAAGYLSSGGGSAVGVSGFLLKARHFLTTHGGVAGASTAASVVAVGVATVVIINATGGAQRDTASDVPRVIIPAPSSSGASSDPGASTGESPQTSGGTPPSKGPGFLAPPLGSAFPTVLIPATSTTDATTSSTDTSSTDTTSTTVVDTTTGTTTYTTGTVPTTATSSTSTGTTSSATTGTTSSSSGTTSSGPTTTTTTTSGGSTSTDPTTTSASTTSTSTTTTTTTTTTTSPVPVGLGVSITGTLTPLDVFNIDVAVTRGDVSGPLTLTLDGQDAIFWTATSLDWVCDKKWPSSEYTCTSNADSPDPLVLTGWRWHKGYVSATLSAPGATSVTDSWP